MKKILLILPILLLVSCSDNTVVIDPDYQWSKCYDNDTPSFSQEYMDKDTQTQFDKAEKEYGKCYPTMQGRQDIIGCTGDFFNEFICFKK